MRTVAFVLVTVVIGTAPAGCGGGDINDEDQSHAEAITLTLDDFPMGWREGANEDEDGEEPIEECATFDFSEVTVTGRAEPNSFMSGSLKTASSLAIVFEEDADPAFTQLASDGTANCHRDNIAALKEDPPEGVTFGDARVREISFPAVGEASRAYEVVLEAQVEGQSVNIYADLVFINKGRSIALLHFVNAPTPIDNDLKVELAKTVAARM